MTIPSFEFTTLALQKAVKFDLSMHISPAYVPIPSIMFNNGCVGIVPTGFNCSFIIHNATYRKQPISIPFIFCSTISQISKLYIEWQFIMVHYCAASLHQLLLAINYLIQISPDCRFYARVRFCTDIIISHQPLGLTRSRQCRISNSASSPALRKLL